MEHLVIDNLTTVTGHPDSHGPPRGQGGSGGGGGGGAPSSDDQYQKRGHQRNGCTRGQMPVCGFCDVNILSHFVFHASDTCSEYRNEIYSYLNIFQLSKLVTFFISVQN